MAGAAMIARFMPVLIVLLMTLLFGWLLTGPEKPAEMVEVRHAPVVDLPMLGNTAKRGLPQGDWLLVNFFASWCVPCVLEAPYLKALHGKVKVVGIAYKDTTVMTKTFLQQRGNPYALVLQDNVGKAAIDFGISGVPESFLVNPAGEIVWHVVGPVMDKQVADIKKVINDR